MDEKPKRWLAPTTVMAASTGPAHGTKTRPRLRPEDEPSALGLLPAAGQPGERPLQPLAHRRDDQAQPDQAEDDQADPPQQVLGQAQQAEQPRADQGEDGEAEHQAADHGEGSAAATELGPAGVSDPGPVRRGRRWSTGARRRPRRSAPEVGAAVPAPVGAGGAGGPGGPVGTGGIRGSGRPVLETAGRPGGEDHREHREDARRDSGDQSAEEPDEDQDDHRNSLP